MTNNHYAISYDGNGTAQQDSLPPVSVYQPQPLGAPKRARKLVSAGVGMMFGVMMSGVLLFGAETLAPPDYKPSAIMGGYQGRLQAEIRARELETQARYDAWMQEVQVSVAQQQAGYQGHVQGVITNYQAAYERARVFSEATARIQQDYVHQTMVQRQQQQQGSTTVVSWAQMLADVVRPFDPYTSDRIDSYADDVSSRLRGKLDASVQQGITIDVTGWNTGLPTPEAVRADLSAITPIVIPPPPHISRDNPQGQD